MGVTRGTWILALSASIVGTSWVGVVPPCHADTEVPAAVSPSPSPSATQVDPRFYDLPEFGTQAISPPAGSAKVGDAIVIRVDGVPNGAGALSVSPPAGAPALLDLGWDLKTMITWAEEGARFRAYALKPGHLQLPALEVRGADGTPVARTHPLELEVASGIAANDPHPETAAESLKMLGLEFPRWVVYASMAGIALVIALISWLVWRKLSRRKPKQLETASRAPLSEHEEALRNLAELEAQSLWTKGQFKKHYFRVSEVLKRYISRRYRFEAMESTTRELVDRLMGHEGLPRETVLELKDLFDALDQVKFTDHVPAPEHGQQILAQARSWIGRTRRPSSEAGPSAV